MKVIIDIPDVMKYDYETDKFKNFFERCIMDMGCCCGLYEKEIAETLEKAFKESTVIK